MNFLKLVPQMTLAAGLCLTAFAAEDKSMTKTVTGCFDKGGTGGEYTLTGNDGKVWAVTGANADLDKHAMRHTVKLTGKHEDHAGKKMFKAEKIEHVSDTCKTASSG